MVNGPTPPARAQRWLQRWLPALERDELIGDLNEEFQERLVTSGRRPARRWYWRQACGLILRRRALSRTNSLGEGSAALAWSGVGDDLRYGWRALRRAPVYSTVAILSLVVSLGLATAVLSVVKTVLLEPLAVPTADRIVRLGIRSADFQRQVLSVGATPAPPSLPDVVLGAWHLDSRTLEKTTTYDVQPVTLALDGEVLRSEASSVGASFFSILPVRPLAGRALQEQDWPAGAPKVAVVSARLVSPRHADPATVLGRVITLDEVSHEIVGVLPADFEWPSRTVDVWKVDRWRPPPPDQARQAFRTPSVLGLLRPGASIDEARREGQVLVDGLVSAGVRVNPMSAAAPSVEVHYLKDELIDPVRPALLLLVAGTIGILIAANVTLIGFWISRNAARRRDLAVRQTLGATGWRLVRPLLAEQFWLSTAGLAGGLALAVLLLEALPWAAPPDLPRLSAVALDGWSFGFAALVAAVTAAGAGVVPAIGMVRANLRTTAADGGATVIGSGSADRLRARLVIGQICVATVLLVGSTLVGRSLMAMLQIDTGYRPQGVLTFQLGTPQPGFSPTGPVTQFYETLFERMRAIPGVVSAGTSNALLLHGRPSGMTYRIQGLTPPQPDGVILYSQTEHVSASYLQTLGATLVAGRFFDERDVDGGQKVVIVNEPFVQTFMPGVNPLGQITPRGVHRPVVVGVIKAMKRAAATEADLPVMYSPAAQTIEAVALSPGRAMGVAVRTTGDPLALAREIRGLITELAPGVPIHNMMPLDVRVATTYAQPRFFAIALVLFAALALATTVLGVYGTLASAVERRRAELGLRRALGATTRDLVVLVVGQAIRLAAVGFGGGLLLAAGASVWGRSALYGVTPVDTLSYAVAFPAVLLVVLVGAWVPMRTALRIDPARVLKAE